MRRYEATGEQRVSTIGGTPGGGKEVDLPSAAGLSNPPFYPSEEDVNLMMIVDCLFHPNLFQEQHPPPPIRDAAFSIKSHHTQAMEPK